MVLGIFGFIIIDHLYIVYDFKTHVIHNSEWTQRHAGKNHPGAIDILEIHKSIRPHIQGFPLDGSPDPVEAKPQYLFANLKGDTADGLNKRFSCCHYLGSGLRSAHDIHHVQSHCRNVKMEVQTSIRALGGAFNL